MSHHAARDARCVPVRFASGAHITRASRRLWATQSTCCSTSAWFRTTCQISVAPCRPMPTRQIPSCTCSVRAHPARGMHVECRGSGWVPHNTTPLSPDRGSPHSHIPHIHTPPSAPALGGHEGETPQPPSPHRLARQAPLAPTLPAPLKGARGNGSRPPMHARRCSTHARFVRGRGRRHGSGAGRTELSYFVMSTSCWQGRTVRHVPAGTREHPMRAPLPWRGKNAS